MNMVETGPFAYFVFASRSREPAEADVRSGVYLRGAAEGRYLQAFFERVFAELGIGISPSADACLCGETALRVLGGCVREALEAVARQDDQWPVFMGYALDDKTGQVGDPVFEVASKGSLLTFLEAIEVLIDRALAQRGCVHFGGGE